MPKPKPKPNPPIAPKPAAQPVSPVADGVPIVGVGASAGGLEALEDLFRNMPPNSGLAFVVVQHMDPHHKGMLVELLQRSTSLTVLQATDRLRVEADRIYVIPPDRDLSILRGVLHLFPPAAPRGYRMPIDFFLRSLATDRRDRSIGVILSGMGSDGTLGLAAIKEQAGACFVQEPASAKFDGMPRSAVEAGVADVVAPAGELAGKIVAYHRRTPRAGLADVVLGGKAHSAIDRVCLLLRAATGHDFSQYKRSTLYRRIERRIGLHQIDGISAYVAFLQENPQEAQLLFNELLIGVTRFFRDPEAWDRLRERAVPQILSHHASGQPLRAWVAGCSTGEEAYSLAIVLKEALAADRSPRGLPLQIFATDLDKDAIDKARQGVYPPNIVADVSPERLRRWFERDARGYRVTPEIRDAVVFAPHDVIADPPFTKLDLLSCRNLLIYLAPELQQKLLPLFHYSINPGGFLFLGSAETVGLADDLFVPLDAKARVYRRQDAPRRFATLEIPATFAQRPLPPAASPPAPRLQSLADQLLLQRHAPAAVLTTAQGDIVYVSGRTGLYLEPAAGKANWNIHAMAHERLRGALGAAFRQAVRGASPVVQSGLRVSATDSRALCLTVEKLDEPEGLRGLFLVVFGQEAPVAAPTRRAAPHVSGPAAKLRRDLERALTELASTRRHMQSAEEGLRAANEELQSTNEELQSTNEELTTSKEEMQSLNEELQTLNHELQAKVDELSRTNDDMRNLLDSTEIATLFLDDALRVRRFTAPMTKIVKLIPGDVDRPITDLASELDYSDLVADAREVLRTLLSRERQVTASGERWFSVRIMPYRTLTNRVDGVVITFVDITAAKTLEATLRHRRSTEGEHP